MDRYLPYIKLGVYFKLLNPSTSLNPHQIISKDILISTISKTYPVKQKEEALIQEGIESLTKNKK